jgi:hypothetical protein
MPKRPGRDRDNVALTAEIQPEQVPHLSFDRPALAKIHIHEVHNAKERKQSHSCRKRR